MSTAQDTPAKGGRRKLSKKGRVDLAGKSVSAACIAIVVLLVITLIFMVAQHGLATFFVNGISPIAFLTGTEWNPHVDDANGMPTVGALPMIVGSFAVTLLSTIIAIPFAIGSAIFVVEVAPKFGRSVFQPVVELLVGIPSVVYGLVGMLVLVPGIRQVFHIPDGSGLLAAIIVLAIMILPSIINVAMTALEAVPREYEDASLALGATATETWFRVSVPAARSGIAAAVVLGVGRAIGEAMAVMMVSGNVPNMPSLFQSVRFLTTAVASEMGYAAAGLQRQALFSIALVLFLFIMLINAALNFFLKRSKEK